VDSIDPVLSAELIVNHIKERTSKIGAWQGEHTIEKTPLGPLLIHNTSEALAAVNKSLADLWPLTMPPSLSVRLTEVDVDEATLGRFREALGVATFPAPFGKDDRSRILQSLAGGSSVEDVSVTCYPAQRAFVSAHPTPCEACPPGAKPRPRSLRTFLGVRVVPSPGKKDCLLEVRAELGKRADSTATIPGDEEGGESWRFSSTVPLGGGLILGAYPTPGSARRWRVCFVSCSNDR
jgi:hypothetical protein